MPLLWQNNQKSIIKQMIEKQFSELEECVKESIRDRFNPLVLFEGRDPDAVEYSDNMKHCSIIYKMDYGSYGVHKWY